MFKIRSSLNIHCETCAVQGLCLARNQTSETIAKVNDLVQKIKPIAKNEHLVNMNDAVINVYAVYTGSCKEYQVDENGNEVIKNFFFPGDIIGLESIPDRKHLFTVAALEEAQLCVIPLDALFLLMSTNTELLKRFIDIGSYKMQNDIQIRTTTNANQRIADFILNMYNRLQERQMYQDGMELPMSQLDISNFLGMAHETVNRILRTMHKNKIIQFKNKKISHVNLDKLSSTMI